jgi:hypothetical protein
LSANENLTERALSFASLPDRLDSWRILAIGGDDLGRDYLTGIGASEFVALDRPSEDAGLEAAAFDLAICGSELETDAHPLATYAWLRRALKPEGILVAGSKVLPDPAKSQYAHFFPAEKAGGSSHWAPGRLAFRWMVEVSGFDVDHWLGERGELSECSTVAHLQARTAERTPALDLERQPLNG